MFTKDKKNKILERFKSKEEKILVSNILDKVYRYEKTQKLEYTNFLNLNELNIVTGILNELKVEYTIFSLDDKLTKKVIFFMPEYIDVNNEFISNYITCIKIIPNISNKLMHKDYMGAIYSLGIKNEVVGDIFVTENAGYVFCLKSIAEYIVSSLYKVGNQEVQIKEVSCFSEEIEKLNINLEKKEYIVPSLRIDAVLAVVYNLSRSEVKDKITKGDLYINDKLEYCLSTCLKESDIVSFRKCGKLKLGSTVRKTRSDRLVINIFKYI